MTEQVDFWFDPACPWAWLTSRWMLEVEQVRDVKTNWHVMSLVLLNKDRDNLPEGYKERIQRALGPVRVCVAAELDKGPDILLPLYTALGNRRHVEQRDDDAIIGDALAEVGLPAEFVQAATTTDFDEALQKSHDEGMNLVGDDVGTPVIRVGSSAIFGPVVTPFPRGEAAGRLWDGVLTVIGTDGFFELKRTRDRRPDFD